MPSAEYMRGYRANNEKYRERERKRARIRDKALRETAKIHKATYNRLYARYSQEAGFTEEEN